MEKKNEMTVQQCIKEVAKHFTGCNYSFANWAQLNVILDEVEEDKPTICYILPPSGTFSVKRSATMFQDKPLTQIAFIVNTEHDFDGEENDDKVEMMKRLAKMFIQELNASGYFEFIDDEEILYQVPYDTLDDNLTGIIVTFPIVQESSIMCKMPDEFGYVEHLD